MSIKLIVHKFEKGINFKSLHIFIEQKKDGSSETIFGTWVDGRVELKSKNIEKSRLVVKVVTGDADSTNLGIDLLANEAGNIDLCTKSAFDVKFSSSKSGTIIDKSTSDCFNDSSQYYVKDNQGANPHVDRIEKNCAIEKQILLNPLEYRIEKVKENNAKIMENIHMLNRTLNYTKKKEILDMINPKPLHSYPCNECGKCFVYETGLRRHFFIRHRNLETQPRWQTVWTCAECFQVWPRKDFALKHSSRCCQNDNSDFIREIKTSLLLQCEFCEKVFTSIPRLLRHSKSHTIESNYECDSCGIAFLSFKNAEQHWSVCPWLQINYKFSLPKMLLCNACDRKFRNYDHLYNHRYKAGHFFCKPCDIHNLKSIFKLVYQCEECSQWFLLTSELESHRNQYHPPRLNSGLPGNYESNLSTF